MMRGATVFDMIGIEDIDADVSQESCLSGWLVIRSVRTSSSFWSSSKFFIFSYGTKECSVSSWCFLLSFWFCFLFFLRLERNWFRYLKYIKVWRIKSEDIGELLTRGKLSGVTQLLRLKIIKLTLLSFSFSVSWFPDELCWWLLSSMYSALFSFLQIRNIFYLL